MASEQLTHDDYTVGWVCALPKELTAAAAMLDEPHPDLPKPPTDRNSYILGRVGKHHVVLACLPKGEIGNSSSATVAAHMIATFPSIKFGLMVGIGGGVPKTVRLGDVVVGTPSDEFGGVVQWDFGKTQQGGRFKRTGALNRPPTELLTALTRLELDHEMRGSKIPQYLGELEKNWPKLVPKYIRSTSLKDVLFRADYNHVEKPQNCDTDHADSTEGEDDEEERNPCINCDEAKVVRRKPRDMRVHHGLIASGNQVIKDAAFRDKINKELGGKVLCFEMEAAGLMNDFPCLVIRGICDYADSHKNNNWQEHAAAVAAAFAKELLSVVQMQEVKTMPVIKAELFEELRAVNRGIEKAFDQRESHHHEQVTRYQAEDQRRCHQTFKTSAYEQQKNINPDRVEGTCEWALKSHEYQRWWKATDIDILWISADPGCGKSVLAKSLVDDIFKPTAPTTLVCYFFFKDNDEQNNLATALCAILHQFFGFQPELLRHALPYWEKSRDKIQSEVEDLWRIFMAATSDPTSRNVICVFDALDECRRQDQKQLIKKLQEYHRQPTSPARKNWVKFLVTSRPYDEIQEDFQTLIESFPQIHLRGEEENAQIHDEISLVVKIRVAELAQTLKFKAQTQEQLEKELLQMEHRTYLWLYLALDDISTMFKDSLRPDQEQIRLIPRSVDAAYHKILDRISPEQEETVRTIFQIIVGSRRPLTIQEMAIALGVATAIDANTVEEAGIDPEGLGAKIRRLCGLFVFIKDSRIYLIHQTAREFLTYKTPEPPNKKWYFEHDDTEITMTRICAKYLLLLENDGRLEVQNLLDYSAKNWPHHFREISSPTPDLVDIVYRLYNPGGGIFSLWFPIFWDVIGSGSPPEINVLHLAAITGHDEIIRQLLMHDTNSINILDSRRMTPLGWACLQGHPKSAQLLLESGADVNVQNGHYSTALQAASSHGHLNIVQLLLERGADINAQGGEMYDTALQAASSNGHLNIVQLLLERGADINAQVGLYGTALQAASAYRHINVVQLLLERGADINSQCGTYGTALQAASAHGYINIVQLLLERGADINGPVGYYGTALQAASTYGHINIVQLLLERGADINGQAGYHGTALQVASAHGYLNIVQLLLERGADINAQGGTYGTALHTASAHGHLNIVQLLLERGADINAQVGLYGTALQAASSNGHLNIVQILQKNKDLGIQSCVA